MSFNEAVKKYKWLLIGVGGLIAVVLIVAWASGTPADESTASLGDVTEGDVGGVPAGESGFVVGDDGRLIVVADSTGTASGSSGSGSSGSDSDASSGEGNPPVLPGSDDEVPPPAAPGAVITVKVMFWNDTASNGADGAQIAIASNSWSPDTSADSDSAEIDELTYDEELVLTVWPNGSGGERFTVPVTFTSIMESGSERDAIHVEISDGQVRVIGNAVENFDARFDRP